MGKGSTIREIFCISGEMNAGLVTSVASGSAEMPGMPEESASEVSSRYHVTEEPKRGHAVTVQTRRPGKEKLMETGRGTKA